jgi:hypothetical protein
MTSHARNTEGFQLLSISCFQNDLRKSLASILAFHQLKIPQRQGPAGCRGFSLATANESPVSADHREGLAVQAGGIEQLDAGILPKSPETIGPKGRPLSRKPVNGIFDVTRSK